MKKLLNAYIIEDDFSHAKIMKAAIQLFSTDNNFVDFKVQQIPDYINFYNDLESFSFINSDIFIIDIHLHTFFTGIQLAQKIRKLNSHVFIIFLTSDPSKGIKIINSNISPIGYILKNADSNLFFREELFSCLKSIEQKLITPEENTLSVKSGRNTIIFQFSEICYIASVKGRRNKVEIKTIHQEIICDEKLSDLKKKLDSEYFYKELKSYIINLNFIQSYNRLDGVIIFKDRSELYFGTKVVTKIGNAYLAYIEGRGL